MVEAHRSQLSVSVQREDTPGGGDFYNRPLQYVEVFNSDGSRKAVYSRIHLLSVDQVRPLFIVTTRVSDYEQRQLSQHRTGINGIAVVDEPGLSARVVARHGFEADAAESLHISDTDTILFIPPSSSSDYSLGVRYGQKAVRLHVNNRARPRTAIDTLVEFGHRSSPDTEELPISIAKAAARVVHAAIEQEYYSYFTDPKFREAQTEQPPYLFLDKKGSSHLLFYKQVPEFALEVDKRWIPDLNSPNAEFTYHPSSHRYFDAIGSHFGITSGMFFTVGVHRDESTQEKAKELAQRYPHLAELKPRFFETTYIVDPSGKIGKVSLLPTIFRDLRTPIITKTTVGISARDKTNGLDVAPLLTTNAVVSEVNPGELEKIQADLSLIEKKLRTG